MTNYIRFCRTVLQSAHVENSGLYSEKHSGQNLASKSTGGWFTASQPFSSQFAHWYKRNAPTGIQRSANIPSSAAVTPRRINMTPKRPQNCLFVNQSTGPIMSEFNKSYQIGNCNTYTVGVIYEYE